MNVSLFVIACGIGTLSEKRQTSEEAPLKFCVEIILYLYFEQQPLLFWVIISNFVS